MNLFNAISVGFKEIWAHKFRSVLTMLGIILGVSSLVGMSALVAGMEKGAREALVAIGALNKFRVETQRLPVEQRYLADQAPGLTLNDVEALQHGAPLLDAISPEIRLRGVTLTANGKSTRVWRCVGVWPVAAELSEMVVDHGRMLTEVDEEEARSVCVIGTRARDELFGSPEETGEPVNPVGKIVYFNMQPFTVVGMFQHSESEAEKRQRELEQAKAKQADQTTGPKRRQGRRRSAGSFVFRLKNSTVFMPLSTARLKFLAGQANKPDDQLSTIEVRIDNYEKLDPALQQARNILMNTHNAIQDFEFRTSEEWADSVAEFIRNARISGGMISGVSLLVGGIGIMNIMLASIASRIREIGIRKAVGARTLDVFLQVLIESMVIAVLGGLAGLAAAYGLVSVIASLTPEGNAPIVTLPILLFAFACCVAIGMLAGLIPAVKAARLDPITALRYE